MPRKGGPFACRPGVLLDADPGGPKSAEGGSLTLPVYKFYVICGVAAVDAGTAAGGTERCARPRLGGVGDSVGGRRPGLRRLQRGDIGYIRPSPMYRRSTQFGAEQRFVPGLCPWSGSRQVARPVGRCTDRTLHRWWEARIARQKEIDASIPSKRTSSICTTTPTRIAESSGLPAPSLWRVLRRTERSV